MDTKVLAKQSNKEPAPLNDHEKRIKDVQQSNEPPDGDSLSEISRLGLQEGSQRNGFYISIQLDMSIENARVNLIRKINMLDRLIKLINEREIEKRMSKARADGRWLEWPCDLGFRLISRVVHGGKEREQNIITYFV
ncbi:hypothetical protein HAX54_032558 [Datura stramonium]|uniref:Uncharacterized protein n=1 Tax=Datura stramonium TaxID=4076 RepID=A0ABS8SCP9_DATST|nr:hypothetical protein [Datura stramonium]